MIGRVWRALIAAAPVRLWALIWAGPPLTLGASWLAWIVWRGGWPAALAGKQLEILGYALFAALGLIGVIVVSLASVKVRGQGLGGTSIEIDGDHDDPPAAKATATVSVSAPAASAAPTE